MRKQLVEYRLSTFVLYLLTLEKTTTLLFSISALAKSMGLVVENIMPRLRPVLTDVADWDAAAALFTDPAATEVDRAERETQAKPRTAEAKDNVISVRATFMVSSSSLSFLQNV